ncbi:MAG: molybdopterin dinucleotide binding domain-containing protein, partial [Actinomycetes bacterium]
WPVRANVADPDPALVTGLTGSEAVAELIYREICLPSASGGTNWIYTGAYNNSLTETVPGTPNWTTDNKASGQSPWTVMNRSKSRNRTDDGGVLAYHGWGYAWLVNRRVLYNNSEVLGDVADTFQGCDSAARLFVSTNGAVLNYAKGYRKVHVLLDKPSPVLATNYASPHYAGTNVSLAGRFPAHTEPYETPRQDLLANTSWGRNAKATAWDLVKTSTRVAGRGFTTGGGNPVTDPPASAFPLALTTVRCVEHFQGGPITRNNWWNVELEPEPWIEINSADARTYGINNDDMVRVVTARMVNDAGATVIPASYGSGFRARVGVGLPVNQKTAAGVVAIPWHWGEKGLSTGSRANDLTIDAGDANSVIPEYKACLCRIEKI